MLSKIFNKRTLRDLLFYLGIPLLIWNTCRPLMGDYLAMLLSTVPGVIYTLYVFFKEKQYSITGLFILASMVISGIMNLDSRTAYQMLWNYVYLNIGFVSFWCLSMLVRRPMAMYFFIDYAYLQGVPKAHSRVMYRQMPFFKYFMFLTMFLAFRDFSDIFLRITLIHLYGVEGFNKISLITQIWSYATTFMFVYGIILIIKKIQLNKHNSSQEVVQSQFIPTNQNSTIMENQKKSSSPSLPKGPASGGIPGKATKMPDKIAAIVKKHHETSHLDENGEWKKSIIKKGMAFHKHEK